jgi:hypothetical protein
VKAQFATIEAMLSLLAILSAVSLVASQINHSTAELGAQRIRMREAMAAYDLINEIQHNSSANECIMSLYSSDDAACAEKISNDYSAIFGIGGINLSFVSQPNASTTGKCVPLLMQRINKTGNLCIVVT